MVTFVRLSVAWSLRIPPPQTPGSAAPPVMLRFEMLTFAARGADALATGGGPVLPVIEKTGNGDGVMPSADGSPGGTGPATNWPLIVKTSFAGPVIVISRAIGGRGLVSCIVCGPGPVMSNVT